MSEMSEQAQVDAMKLSVYTSDDHWSADDSVYLRGNPTGAMGGARDIAMILPSYVQTMPVARRLCAAWNAFDGISTETIEKLTTVNAFSGDALAERLELRPERDRLLTEVAELRDALKSCMGLMRGDVQYSAEFIAAEKALYKDTKNG